MNKNGIDVSKWQGNIDWTKVKKAGIDFAIIREGYGKKSPSQVDKMFKINYENAKKNGINVGVYHYSYASSKNDAVLEAQFCLENIQGMQLEYPICFDIEDSEMLAISTQTRTDICRAFCETIEKAGYYVMIYTNMDWYKNKLDGASLSTKYDIWLAQWGVSKPSISCGIWQKSSTGSITGISGNVDLDVSYNDYPMIMKNKGLNGFKKGDTTTPLPQGYINYKVQKGDTLWDLSAKHLGNGALYPKIKELNNLNSDTIYIGQILKIPK